MEMQNVASYSSFEYTEILFRLPATVLRIGILYRPPEEERWLSHNPKRFWKYVKSMTKQNTSPNFLRKGQTIITKPSIKANMLNDFFQSVFSSVPVLNTQPTTAPRSPNRLSEIYLTTSQVYDILSKIDPSKASGPDNLPGRILKEVAAEISPSITKLFNLSLSMGCFPEQWKLANLTPIHKKDDPTLAQNYRPISLLCILSKVFERCVFNHCFPFLCPQFYHLQHGFLKGRSTTSQLLLVYNDILTYLSRGYKSTLFFSTMRKPSTKFPMGI